MRTFKKKIIELSRKCLAMALGTIFAVVMPGSSAASTPGPGTCTWQSGYSFTFRFIPKVEDMKSFGQGPFTVDCENNYNGAAAPKARTCSVLYGVSPNAKCNIENAIGEVKSIICDNSLYNCVAHISEGLPISQSPRSRDDKPILKE